MHPNQPDIGEEASLAEVDMMLDLLDAPLLATYEWEFPTPEPRSPQLRWDADELVIEQPGLASRLDGA